MLEVSFAKQKSQAMLEQITQLQSADYPYSEPKVALGLLHDLFKEDLGRLSRIDASADITLRHQVCAHANVNVAVYLPVLGFLVRAAETRNTFELYDPLLRLCHGLCGKEAKLVLSSEWNFSPITYPAVFPNLPDLIFIGLPACEAANSLIAPLAGHEFGHSVWRRQRSKAEIADLLQKKLLATFVGKITDNWQDFSSLFAVTLAVI